MRALLPSNLAVQALSLALATIGGAVVALLLVGGTGGRDTSAGSAARTVPLATPVAEATRSALQAVLMSSAAAEPAAAPNQSIAVATPAPTPSADDQWSALQPQLDAAWQTGPDQTIPLLEAFLLSAPDYPAGREKLYAALVAHGHDLFGQGDVTAATSQLERAQQLFPDRTEASDLLSAMTPEPAVEPAPPEADPAAQGDVPADANLPTQADVAAADANPPTQSDVVAADANTPTQDDPPVADDPPPITHAAVALAPVAPARVQPAAPPRTQPAAVPPVRQPAPPAPLPTPTKVPFVPT
jgi:hypothetical protein